MKKLLLLLILVITLLPFPLAAHSQAVYQLRSNGEVWEYIGGYNWQKLDNNSHTKGIASSGNKLYQLRDNGEIWQFTGTPCSGDSCLGWQLLDNNSHTKAIVSSDNKLYQLHDTGAIWQFTGTPCSVDSCIGWQMLYNVQMIDSNTQMLDSMPQVNAIAAAGNRLYQLHNSGEIWQFTGTPCIGSFCPGWQKLDKNTHTKSIAADGYKLYQLHDTGAIWQFTGTPCSGDSCIGWQLLDNNSHTKTIAAAGDKLYQLHDSGAIWQFTGTPCSGDSCPGWQTLSNSSHTTAIAAADHSLYQLNDSGEIWQYVSTPYKLWMRIFSFPIPINPNITVIGAAPFRGSKTIKLPVVVIKAADSNGDNDASHFFSDETIKTMIEDTNKIFMPDAGIEIVLHEISNVKNTLINRLTDWSVAGCPDAEQVYPHPDLEGYYLSLNQLEAYNYAKNKYPNKIVFYIRLHFYDANCTVQELPGGFSHSDLNFVALSPWKKDATTNFGICFNFSCDPRPQTIPTFMAHELGHYLGITHPMPNGGTYDNNILGMRWPQNKDEATAEFDRFCQDQPELIKHYLGDNVWDGDRLIDTPGDAGFDLYNNILFNIGPGQQTYQKNECIGDGVFTVTSNYCQEKGGLSSNVFTVRSARDNLMSYTAQCPYFPGNTTGEIRARITPQQLSVILHSLDTNRKNLLMKPISIQPVLNIILKK